MAPTTSSNLSGRNKRYGHDKGYGHDKSYGNDKNDSMKLIALDSASSPSSCVGKNKQYKTVQNQKSDENDQVYPLMD